MALIKCPECGKEISDRSQSCIFCGYPLCTTNDDENIMADDVPQKVEVTSVSLKSNAKAKKVLLIALIFAFVLIGAFFTIKAVKDQKAKKEYEIAFNNYVDNLYLAQMSMLSGASDAESLCNLIYRVWSNAIYEKSDITTDKYTRPNGYSYVDDFNEALRNLFNDAKTEKTVSDIEYSQRNVGEFMRDLQNPPDGLEQCYQTITDLYSAYKALTDLAISPKGNLGTFGDSKGSKVDDFMRAYDKLNTQMPEKIS